MILSNVGVIRSAAKATGNHVRAFESEGRTSGRVADRNDMLDLTICLQEIDLAVTAEPVLKIGEAFDEFSVTFPPCRMTAISFPSRIGTGVLLVAGKTGDGVPHSSDPFQDSAPSFLKIS